MTMKHDVSKHIDDFFGTWA